MLRGYVGMSMLSDQGGRCLEGIRVVLRVVGLLFLFLLLLLVLVLVLVLVFDMKRMMMMTRKGSWLSNLNWRTTTTTTKR